MKRYFTKYPNNYIRASEDEYITWENRPLIDFLLTLDSDGYVDYVDVIYYQPPVRKSMYYGKVDRLIDEIKILRPPHFHKPLTLDKLYIDRIYLDPRDQYCIEVFD